MDPGALLPDDRQRVQLRPGEVEQQGLVAGIELTHQAGVTLRFGTQIVELLGTTGRPAIYGNDRFVRMGGLMSYSQSFDDPSARVVRMARSVLQGFPVGELPVEHPEAFRFAINTDTWRATRPAPPARLLLLATEFYSRDAAP